MGFQACVKSDDDVGATVSPLLIDSKDPMLNYVASVIMSIAIGEIHTYKQEAERHQKIIRPTILLVSVYAKCD